MKNWTWKQWSALGLIAVVAITLLVLHFVQPKVSYAFTEAMTAGGVAVGILIGHLLKKNNIVNKNEKQLLTD